MTVIEIHQTEVFARWLAKLRDPKAVARIAVRIERLRFGHWGDHKRFDGLVELRVDYGPGYRVYATERGGELVILLCGGDKRRQDADIRKARKLAAEL